MAVEQTSSIDSTDAVGGASEPGHPGKIAGITARMRWCLARRSLILWTASVIAAMGLAAGLFFGQYRPDRRLDDAAKQQVIDAASDGAVALLSYSANNLNRDFDRARSHLTGDLLTYYNQFTAQIVSPAAQQMQLAQTAKVVRAAVSDLQPDSAIVLVFLDQTTTSKQKPKPLVTPSGVRVTLRKVNGSWLIEKFDPL
ncbi:hypothetical protein MXEN_18589 [Mycobacterium xenopi RIVM700367]|uniref:Twin-arginine translocation pathway signal n=1 Tax=Mycobacterium xenopi TaxID=1789 RepID=A0AAD1GY45_MYCXE|nr:hypothetical protein MXEN_18589 [Mycobacterium xenopi RIVM700367]BBU21333.1 hypothetical protein MYXE_11220 [Mycobacterium xenopi]SPX78776.1 twin-arginine translocation pathway signal [Mycobacterium xenopi]